MRAVALVILGWCVLAVGSSETAQGAVSFRSSSAASSATSGGVGPNFLDLTIARPAGLAVNDLMIATIQWVLKTDNGSTVTATPPSGWTQIDNNNQVGWAVVVWWKRATASDVAASSYTFTGNWTNRNATAAGVVSAYSGVAPTGAPLTWGSVTRTGFNSTFLANGSAGFAQPGRTAYSAPAYTPTPGSLGVVAVMADRTGNSNQLDLSSTQGGTLIASQPAVGGGGVDGINTAVAYATPDGSGAYGTTPYADNFSYVKMTFANTIQWTAFSFVLKPAPPCGLSADLLLTSTPSSVSFGSSSLSGSDLTLTAPVSLTVDDQTTTDGATSAGWNLSLHATQFTSGGNTLPSTALRVTSASSADAGGRCAAPVNPVGYPVIVPASTTTKIYAASVNSGRGASTVTLGMGLVVPGGSRSGSYSSTWTYTLTSGP